MNYPALLTDLYQLTMLAGYYEKGMHQKQAVFDLFFRKVPSRVVMPFSPGLKQPSTTFPDCILPGMRSPTFAHWKFSNLLFSNI